MDLPSGHYRILAYRDFHDLPRWMHVADGASKQWVLDCPFDDARDEYSQVYRIYAVEVDVEGAVDVWERHALGVLPEIGSLPVSALQFDATRRASFVLP